MKIRITNYTFNAASGKVTFNDYTSINLEGVLIIENAVNNTMIYNFAANTKGGTVAGNVLTLTYNTTNMSNTDPLLIYYDDRYTTAATDESLLLLRRIAKLLESSATVDRNNRQRVTLDAVQTNTAGATTELTGSVPFTLAASGALGFQAGLNYGQPVTGTVPYSTNTLASSWYSPSWEGPVDQRWRVAEDSHLGYQVGCRAYLSFS